MSNGLNPAISCGLGLVLLALVCSAQAQVTDARVRWACEAAEGSIAVSIAVRERSDSRAQFSAEGFHERCSVGGATWDVKTTWLIREGGPCSADPSLLITIKRNGRTLVEKVYADVACWERDATFSSLVATERPGVTTIQLCFLDYGDLEHCRTLVAIPKRPIDRTEAEEWVADAESGGRSIGG